MAEIKWIPFSKKKPDKTGDYLITWKISKTGKKVVSIWWYVKDDVGFGKHMEKRIIAWSPLPKPYDEKEETDGV